MLVTSIIEKQDVYQDDEDIISQLYGSGEIVIDEKKYYLKPDADLARAITMDEFASRAKEHIRNLYKQDRK